MAYFVETQIKNRHPVVFNQYECAKRLGNKKRTYYFEQAEPIDDTTTVVTCYRGNLLTIVARMLRIRTGEDINAPVTLADKKAAFQWIVENPYTYMYDTLYAQKQEKIFASEVTRFTRSLSEAEVLIDRDVIYTFNDLLYNDIEFYKVRCLPTCFRIEYTTSFTTYDPWTEEVVEVGMLIHESMLHPPRQEFSEDGKYEDDFTEFSVYDPADYDPANEWEDVDVSSINRARNHSLTCDYDFTVSAILDRILDEE